MRPSLTALSRSVHTESWQSNPVVTRDAMLREAESRGYGTGRSLGAAFINWQRRGLIAAAAGKAPRRGGEGLWHERQLWIWLSLLHLRAQGAHLLVLANVPVACWMLGISGVETDQVQKVFAEFWGSPKRLPDLARSPGRRRQVDRAVDWMAAPDASVTARRRYRRALAQASEALPDLGVSAKAYAEAAEGVLAPGGKPMPAQKAAIDTAYGVLSLRALALSQMPKLTRPTDEVVKFWEWSRRAFQLTWRHYATAQPTLATQPLVGHMYDAPDLSGLGLLTENGCITQLTVLGVGLDALRSGEEVPPGLEAPPKLSWWP
jgi:hypothetical protein